MLIRRLKHIVILCMLSPVILKGQDVDPYGIIDSVSSRIDKILDYQADIEIEVDVDFIMMPVKHATIYYKSPDKIKFESDEFLMLPKKGLGNRITQILDEPYAAIYLQDEILNNQPHHVIRIVPMGKNPDIVVATWWISEHNYLIARNESTTRNQGDFTVDFIYGNSAIQLPTEMIFSFEIEKLKLPLKFIGKSGGMEMDKSKMKDVNQGKVYIRFSNYIINSSMTDDIFNDDGTSSDNGN